MSAQYNAIRVETSAPAKVVAEFAVKNTSGRTWRRDEGFAFSYQVFEFETHTLVVDGKRTALPSDWPSGEGGTFQLECDLPPADGLYRIFISAMKEDVAWFYERGWRFLLIDVTVRDGVVTAKPARVATSMSMRRERVLRAVVLGLILPFATMAGNASLIRSMTRRDVLSRYRGSFIGTFWTVLTPLLLMLTYFFVFGIVLQTRFGADQSRAGFALYFLAGMLPWLPFAEAVGRAPVVILEHRNFVKKMLFPVEIFPINLTAAGLVTEAIALALFVAAVWILRAEVPGTILWLPALLVPQVLFTLGLCWFLAALGVYFRDLGQISTFLLTLWFFLTPICYPESSLPEAARAVLSQNPLFPLVRGYRDVLLEGQAPAMASLVKMWVGGMVVFFAGHAWFYKLRRSFADVI